MRKARYTLRAKVWLYPGESANWHFITLPKKDSEDIKKRFAKVKRGWGSLPVEATVGKTSWETSIFPDKKSGMYLLPLKASVREKEGIGRDDVITFHIQVRL